jgi:hypothetical protein
MLRKIWGQFVCNRVCVRMLCTFFGLRNSKKKPDSDFILFNVIPCVSCTILKMQSLELKLHYWSYTSVSCIFNIIKYFGGTTS